MDKSSQLTSLDLTSYGELSTKQLKQKELLLHAYGQSWSTNLRISKGWVSPSFAQNEIQDLLDEAAEKVVLIRDHLQNTMKRSDLLDSDLLVGTLAGHALEYLWEKQHDPSGQYHPLNDPKTFVRELVHSTFKDEHSYLEGLSEGQLDLCIKEIDSWRQRRESDRLNEATELEKKILLSWENANERCKQIFQFPQEKKKSRHYLNCLNSVSTCIDTFLGHLQELNEEEDRCEKRKNDTEIWKREHECQDTSTSSTVSSEQPSASKEPEQKSEEVKMEATPTESPVAEHVKESSSEQSSPADQAKEPSAEKDKEPSAEQVKEPSTEQDKEPIKESEGGEKTAEVNEPNPGPSPEEARSYALKITKVKEEVNSLKPEIQDLFAGVDELSEEYVSSHGEEAEKKLTRLHTKCLYYIESLMKDLFTLDTLVGSDEKLRVERKEQVKGIQDLLGQVDTLQKKLHKTLVDVKNAKKEQAAKEQAAKEQAGEIAGSSEQTSPKEQVKEPSVGQESPKPSEVETSPKSEQSPQVEVKEDRVTSPVQEVSLQTHAHKASPKKRTWRDLKLKPKFEISENGRAYVLTSYIPGMDPKDIQLSVQGDDNDVLKVSGFRGPNKMEEEMLRSHLRKINISDYTSEDDAMLLYGAGKFGSFSELFRLPEDTNIEEVSASYERGMVRVILPKVIVQRRPQPRMMVPDQYDEDYLGGYGEPVYGYPVPGMYGYGRPQRRPAPQMARGYGGVPLRGSYGRPPVFSAPRGSNFYDNNDLWW